MIELPVDDRAEDAFSVGVVDDERQGDRPFRVLGLLVVFIGIQADGSLGVYRQPGTDQPGSVILEEGDIMLENGLRQVAGHIALGQPGQRWAVGLVAGIPVLDADRPSFGDKPLN